MADDATAAGTLEALLQWYDHLVIEVVRFGYFVNGKKSWLIVKTQEAKERAEKTFGDRVNIVITTEGFYFFLNISPNLHSSFHDIRV